MLSPYRQRGLLGYIDTSERVAMGERVREEIQIAFDELYGSIESVRADAHALAKTLRVVIYGVDDPDRDDWATRVYPAGDVKQ